MKRRFQELGSWVWLLIGFVLIVVLAILTACTKEANEPVRPFATVTYPTHPTSTTRQGVLCHDVRGKPFWTGVEEASHLPAQCGPVLSQR